MCLCDSHVVIVFAYLHGVWPCSVCEHDMPQKIYDQSFRRMKRIMITLKGKKSVPLCVCFGVCTCAEL